MKADVTFVGRLRLRQIYNLYTSHEALYFSWYARSKRHTQLAKVSFDETFDLTPLFFCFFVLIPAVGEYPIVARYTSC